MSYIKITTPYFLPETKGEITKRTYKSKPPQMALFHEKLPCSADIIILSFLIDYHLIIFAIQVSRLVRCAFTAAAASFCTSHRRSLPATNKGTLL